MRFHVKVRLIRRPCLDDIQDSGLLDRYDDDISQRVDQLKERVREVAARTYNEKASELFAVPGVNRALPLLLLTDTLEAWAKQLDKRFRDPLVG